MSRLIVKNLPFSVTEVKLRNSFAKHGSITDLQLKYNKEGKFRGFAFVGYKTEDEAGAAKKFLDGSFFGAAKVKVEFCSEIGKSKSSKKGKKEVAVAPEKKSIEIDKVSDEVEELQNDPKFKEFMNVHSKNDSWGNNNSKKTIPGDQSDGSQEDSPGDEEESEEVSKSVSDLDYLKTKKVNEEKKPKPKKELFTVKVSNLPFKCKKRDLKSFFAPQKPASLRLPPKIKGIAFVGFLTDKEQKIALNKHKSFLGEHQVQVILHRETRKTDITEGKWSKQAAALEGVETVGESGRIFIRNLPYTATEDDITELFSKYGPLTETTVPVDRNTRKYKGFAFVTFMMPEHAVAAFSALDGSTFMGRLLHLLPAKPKDSEADSDPASSTDFKKQKEAKQKAGASNSFNWNTLFLGVNAVADVMSSQYGVDKSRVLMEEDGAKKGASAAVKLALGETEIVGQTRTFLEQEGVRLDAFNRKPDKRSKNVILAKNLPSRTAPEQLRDMFSKFGVIHRLVMPAHCLTAIIEFADPGEARSAFTKLAYTKFHNAPLYLEWAPDDTFFKSFSEYSEGGVGTNHGKEVNDAEKTPIEEEKSDDTDEPEEGSTLFVKNINFDTTDEELLEHFKSCGKVHSANIATKKNTKTDDLLSMGFGFVTFLHKSSAEKALKTLQHSRLGGHCLELKRSTRASTNQEAGNKEKVDLGKASTKILVRNIPFQAKKEEIVALFRTFGAVAGVRLPRKMAGTGEHRGFCFVEFATVSEAKTAFSSLVHSTHLYGRRLVLEWAAGEETLEELRDRTRKHWGDGAVQGNKRARLEMDKKSE